MTKNETFKIRKINGKIKLIFEYNPLKELVARNLGKNNFKIYLKNMLSIL